MKILIAGATGLVGSELVPFLIHAGHEVKKLVRKQNNLSSNEIRWDPENETLDPADVEGYDAIIDLAGENIFGRWTEKKKKLILESRIKATRTLTKTILLLKKPPQTFINASAIGYYGSRGDTLLTENSANGTGFLAHVCQEWEIAAKPVLFKDVRLVYTRFGIILSPKGGALSQMLIPFKLGLGGVIGSGKQFMSWITLDEVLGIFNHILNHESLSGPINVVSPNPVTNYDFTKILGKVLTRPTFLSVPGVFAQFIFGEMADELLLSSQKASCSKLIESGYQFCQPELEKAFRQMLT